jgi:hypothetical protein
VVDQPGLTWTLLLIAGGCVLAALVTVSLGRRILGRRRE